MLEAWRAFGHIPEWTAKTFPSIKKLTGVPDPKDFEGTCSHFLALFDPKKLKDQLYPSLSRFTIYKLNWENLFYIIMSSWKKVSNCTRDKALSFVKAKSRIDIYPVCPGSNFGFWVVFVFINVSIPYQSKSY